MFVAQILVKGGKRPSFLQIMVLSKGQSYITTNALDLSGVLTSYMADKMSQNCQNVKAEDQIWAFKGFMGYFQKIWAQNPNIIHPSQI